MKAYFSKARVKWRLNLNPSLPFSPAPPDSVGATQGQCSNGWCWPHCGTGHERTAVYHKEVGNIVGLVPGIHYRGLRTIAHAYRSHEVAGLGIRFLVVDFGCAGGLQEFASALRAVLQHSTGIFREGINNTRRRNTIRVLCLKVELNSIILVGQILPNGGDMNDMGKAASHHAVMIASPGHIRAQRYAQWPAGPADDQSVTTRETALCIALIELLAVERRVARVQIAVHALGKNATHSAPGVEHTTSSYQAGRVG